MTRLCYHLFLTRLALPKSKSLLLFVSKETNETFPLMVPPPLFMLTRLCNPPKISFSPQQKQWCVLSNFRHMNCFPMVFSPCCIWQGFSCNLVSSLIPGNWMEAFCKTIRFLPFWVWPTDLVWYRWVWFRLSFTRPRFGKVYCAFLGNHCFFCQINRHRRMTRNVWQHSASKSLWTVWKRIVCLLISMTGGKRQGKEASYNGALSAARRDKKAWGRGVAMSIRDNFLIFAIFWHPPFTRRSHHQCRQWCWRYQISDIL